jgi:DNA gyrase subunit B (EC 5.99.1.3)
VVARPKTDAQADAYSGSSITVLEGLEAVRKRPGMYIGSTGERGLHHMVWEVVDNSVDEALAGHCDTVRVTLLRDGGVRVEDNGRGIPVDMHPVEKRPTVEVVMTILHAGGKFDGKSYAVSGGLHGVGVTVVNALSTELDVRIWRDGTEWHQHYTASEPGPLEKVGPTTKRGTQITFWADPGIFETTTYSFDTISRRLQEMAFLNQGLRIVLRDERPGQGKAETGMAEEVSLAEAAPAPTSESRPSSRPRSPTSTRTACGTSSPTSTGPRPPSTARSSASRPRAPARTTWPCPSTSPCSGRRPTPSRCTPSPTPSTPTRAAPTRRASARR